MKSKSIYVIIAVLTVLGGMSLYGCRAHRSPEARAERVIRYMAHELDLTEAQVAQLNAFKDDMLERREKSLESHKVHTDMLMEQLRKDTMDKEVLTAMVDEHRQKMDEVIPLVIDRLTEFHSSLSQEQKTALIEKIESFERLHSCFAE